MHNGLKKQFKAVLKEHEKQLNSLAKNFFSGIVDKFDILCADKEEETDAEKHLREILRENIEEAKRLLNEEIEPRLFELLDKPDDSLFVGDDD